MATRKLSEIASGGSLDGATDQIVVVRGGTTDLLVTPTGAVPSRIISSGSSDSATINDGYVGWASAATSAKTQTIPASTGSDQMLVIKDVQYNSDTYPITIAAASGNIDIYTSVDISTPGGWVTLLDTSNGWSIIG